MFHHSPPRNISVSWTTRARRVAHRIRGAIRSGCNRRVGGSRVPSPRKRDHRCHDEVCRVGGQLPDGVERPQANGKGGPDSLRTVYERADLSADRKLGYPACCLSGSGCAGRSAADGYRFARFASIVSSRRAKSSRRQGPVGTSGGRSMRAHDLLFSRPQGRLLSRSEDSPLSCIPAVVMRKASQRANSTENADSADKAEIVQVAYLL